MRHELQANYPEYFNKVKFYIGNVRDKDSVMTATEGVDFIFHAAALKEVPSCEFFPMQAYKTNVEGTDNVVQSAISNGVKSVVLLSTDKAAYPINAMGISKAMAEHIIYSNAQRAAEHGTTLCCTRYGNVMCSRGSVIPLFREQMRAEKLGCGEIFLNSIDNDGMMQGYDVELVKSVVSSVDIPVTACGGAGGVGDLKEVLIEGHAHAAAGGSMFVFYGRLRAVSQIWGSSSKECFLKNFPTFVM